MIGSTLSGREAALSADVPDVRGLYLQQSLLIAAIQFAHGLGHRLPKAPAAWPHHKLAIG